MNYRFFFYKVPLANWQLSLLKLSSACFGIAIGGYLSNYLKPFLPVFIIVGIISGIWIGAVWYKNMSIVRKIIS